MAFPYLQYEIIQHAFNNLRPGGYLELQDIQFPFQSRLASFQNSAMAKWGNLLIEAAQKLGKDWTCTAKYPRYLEQAGF